MESVRRVRESGQDDPLRNGWRLANVVRQVNPEGEIPPLWAFLDFSQLGLWRKLVEEGRYEFADALIESDVISPYVVRPSGEYSQGFSRGPSHPESCPLRRDHACRCGRR